MLLVFGVIIIEETLWIIETKVDSLRAMKEKPDSSRNNMDS